MAATTQIRRQVFNAVSISLFVLCVLCNGGIALNTSTQATDDSAYLSSVYSSLVDDTVGYSSESTSSWITPTTSAVVETSVTLITSFTSSNTVISSTVGSLTSNTSINEISVTSYLSSTSTIEIPVTAGVDSTSKHLSTSMDQLSSSIVSTTDLASSDMSSAINPSTTHLVIQSSLNTEISTVTDLVLSSSRSFGNTASVIVTSMPSTAAIMTDSSLQPSTVVSNVSSAVTEAVTTLANTTTDGILRSTVTPSSLSSSRSPEFNSSSDGLFTTATTHANTPVYTSTQHAVTTTTSLLRTSSAISHTEHVTSSYHHSSSSSVVIAPTSSTDAGITSSTMTVTPDPALLAELDSLRSKVQELEDSNNGLQTATIVLAILLAVIILVIFGLFYLRRRRIAKRKKNRFGGIDADLTTPVIQRPKPAFGYTDSKDISFGGRVSTATLEESEEGGEMSTLGTFSTLPKSGIHNNNMDTPS
ncbi:cell wall protein DAN4-like [Pecten maximus]|uniref:cell wall protein DAN4-like n=1 Tax=Pecten maximus TaxID=6579 RepID=UPI00145856A7|nr:cell wall protein DAN4-like [Pecten maximus]